MMKCQVTLICALTAVAAACDESFEPTAPSDFAFSVFGYLDASADTQWIRVMPIRPLRTTSPGPLAATVTLEHLGTGRIIQLEDSVFEFSPTSEGAFYVHNFWTPEDIEPGATYRFSARREGKEPAEAVVEIPRDYEVEVAINQVHGREETDELLITGLKHLAILTMATHFYDSCGSSGVGTQYGGRSADDETHLIAIEKPEVTPRTACGLPIVPNRELLIVGSAAAWPAGGHSPGALGAPSWTSNVTNAAGFLGGVLSKVIPYEDCEFQSEGAPVPHYCQLRYNGETATMNGTVSDSGYRCDASLDSVTVLLTELDRDPARVRTALSNHAGEFLIGALQPGIPHLVWARAPPVAIDSEFVARFQWRYTDWYDLHAVHTDTLTFTPGQRLEYDIQLERFLPCKAGTLLGTVTEARCGDGPIDSAIVQLTERDVPPGAIPRTLTGRTNSNGEFFITGLRPLIHFLQVRGPDVVVDSAYNPETGVWDPVLANIYTEHIDHLGFLPDQVVKYDVMLGRLTPCTEPPPGGQ
jgi:hypothetical protein